jgi:DNA-binding response OmpR family regulator
MPQLSGEDFIAAVRANMRIKHIPILLHTAMRPQLTESQWAGIGADAYLAKPAGIEILRDTIRVLLGHPPR